MIKGHTKIELFDAATGRKEKTYEKASEDRKYIAFDEILRILPEKSQTCEMHT